MPKKSKGSADIFNAVSASTRIQTLKLLAIKGPLTYSEIMEMLNFEPTRDAGKFVYHLKNLVSTGLVEFEKNIKKYKVTELGLRIVSFSQDLDEYTLKKTSRMLVRTSKHTVEEFDKGKITLSLINEGGLSQKLADKISSEVEERLLKLPVGYLTAPLIREFVNVILIENGLEDYRHKLTRLGMPVYDVKRTLDEASQKFYSVDYIRTATANRVMTEFVLLDIFPREIADAHLSGQIHITNSHSIFEPSTIYHDLRVFLKHGFKTQQLSLLSAPIDPPKNFVEATSITASIIHFFKREISNEQMIDYFNIFLAPYLKNEQDEIVRRILKTFLLRLSFLNSENEGVTLGLDITIPHNLENLTAIGSGKEETYSEYEPEAQKLLEIILDTALELSKEKPLLNPNFVLKFRSDHISRKYDALLEKAHRLVAKNGSMYIANLTKDPKSIVSNMATGEKMEADWSRDWELDTLRVSCLDNVAINLPRIAHEAKKDDDKFLKGVEEAVDIAIKSLEIKRREVRERTRQRLLPSIASQVESESYLRLDNSVGILSLVGLNEAVKCHLGFEIHEDLMPQHFAVTLIESLVGKVASLSEKMNHRINISPISNVEASQRFAEYDVKNYGLPLSCVQGGKEHPYYTFNSIISNDTELKWEEKLKLEDRFLSFFNGGGFLQIPVDDDVSSESLLKKTKQICQSYNIGFFAYSHILLYCGNCHKTFIGYKQKCPDCGSTQTITYARQSTKYLPLTWWRHKGLISKIRRLR